MKLLLALALTGCGTLYKETKNVREVTCRDWGNCSYYAETTCKAERGRVDAGSISRHKFIGKKAMFYTCK